VEKATAALPPVADLPAPGAPERFDTPGVRTIEDLAVRFDAAAVHQVKTLVYVLDGRPTLALLRGDHALSEQKLADATGATVLRPAHADEIRAALGASPGSLGAVGVTDLPIVADEALRGRRGMVTGANTDDVHLRGVDVDRDLAVGAWADLREVTAGEPCARCGQPLDVVRTIEVGHIFKLGRRYSEALGATVLAADGTRTPVVMGSYGIGVERAMAAIAEAHHDDRGLVWPPAVAPFAVVVVVAQPDHAETAAVGERIYAELRTGGVEVILDDRPERAGVKFRDAELVGIPLRVTVGTRGLAQGTVELTERATGHTERIPVGEVAGVVRTRVTGGADLS
jgi:prolyl-tRNA synthetase